jgi:predicted Holliday junction resolvase-like endonuclease
MVVEILVAGVIILLTLYISEARKNNNSKNQYKKLLSQKKSSETRIGHISETLAPFLDHFEFDPENCSFLGKPIDYIAFEEEAITIIEIKSGKAQLSKKQRQVRDLIKDGKVYWKEIRID